MWHTLITLLRTAVYLWVGVESFFLAHLYYYGYLKFKHTPIICMLQRFFFTLGIFFIILAFLPVITLFTNDNISNLIDFGIVALPALPLGYFLSKFREKSVEAT